MHNFGWKTMWEIEKHYECGHVMTWISYSKFAHI
jgi:hypothetical protein